MLADPRVMSERDTARTVAGPDRSWLSLFMDYGRSITDAPLIFHLASGLATLAGAVGSQVYWVGAGKEQWPNLYVLLVAPSGIFRKSTSIDQPLDILGRAIKGRVMPAEWSQESLLRRLSYNPISVLRESEFASLLERMKLGYMQGTKQKLTDLYDCYQVYERSLENSEARKGPIRIVRPALTILAASTLDWLIDSLTENDMKSGFVPRFLMFPAIEKEPQPEGGYWVTPDKARADSLVSLLKIYSFRERQRVSFDNSAETLVSWANWRMSQADSGQIIPELGGLYSRMSHHVSKLATLLAVSDSGPDERYVITKDVAERAILLMEWILRETNRLFEDRVAFQKHMRDCQSAKYYIGEKGILRSMLLKKMKCSAWDLDRILKTLQERDEVEIVAPPIGVRGRPSAFIVPIRQPEGISPAANGFISPQEMNGFPPGQDPFERAPGKKREEIREVNASGATSQRRNGEENPRDPRKNGEQKGRNGEVIPPGSISPGPFVGRA